jgi:soluble lytic murein transglycosylase-like protein
MRHSVLIAIVLGLALSSPPAFAACEVRDVDGPTAYRKALELMPTNVDQAVAWLQVAALHGQGEALRMLSIVPKNYIRAMPTCGGAAPKNIPEQAQANRWTGGQPPAAIAELVRRLAPGYGLDPQLVFAVISVESGYDRLKVSPKQAAGMMQLIPGTAQRFGVGDVMDAEDNIKGGMAYLRWLLSYFRGDVTLALAAYNAGENVVDRYGGVPPYAETREYLRRIRLSYAATTHPYGAGVANPSPIAKTSAAPGRQS